MVGGSFVVVEVGGACTLRTLDQMQRAESSKSTGTLTGARGGGASRPFPIFCSSQGRHRTSYTQAPAMVHTCYVVPMPSHMLCYEPGRGWALD